MTSHLASTHSRVGLFASCISDGHVGSVPTVSGWEFLLRGLPNQEIAEQNGLFDKVAMERATRGSGPAVGGVSVC